jgi:hypothetical protein
MKNSIPFLTRHSLAMAAMPVLAVLSNGISPTAVGLKTFLGGPVAVGMFEDPQ